MRRRRPERRSINPDPKFNDLEISKFINYLLKKGKKGTAEKIFYTSMKKIEESTKTDDGLQVFKKAIDNGWNICIWPESMKQKDLNDMILSGIQEMKLIEIININTYNGLFAKTKLASWRKK